MKGQAIDPLPPAWFHRPAPALAAALIGTTLTLRGCTGLITETEAYAIDDPASHSFRGRTRRNAAMFGPPGRAYVYRSYGIHLCLNITCGEGGAVLLRALTPQSGLDLMAARRGTNDPRRLTIGPGRLGQALGITLDDNHRPFDSADFAILPGPPCDVITGQRIGITRATDRPWRFGLKGSPYLSQPFPPAPSFCPKYSGG